MSENTQVGAGEAAHTPGQLILSDYYSDDPTITDKDGFQIVSVNRVAILLGYGEKLDIPHWADKPEASREMSSEEVTANARRLVACWNFFNGIDVSEIEGNTLMAERQRAQAAADQHFHQAMQNGAAANTYRAQRDELLAACMAALNLQSELLGENGDIAGASYEVADAMLEARKA